MSHASALSDVFNAVAEPKRREILTVLVGHERSVGELVKLLGIEQPSISKHLRVLREVELVKARREGKQMFYQTNADAIRPLHDWAGFFQRYWSHQLSRIKTRAEERKT